jgi:YYY domain-containing protein
MGNDIYFVIQFWAAFFLVGAAAYPLTKKLFKGWFDSGYFFAKAVGMATVTYIVWLFGSLHIMPFSLITIIVSLLVIFVTGTLLNINHKSLSQLQDQAININLKSKTFLLLISEELFFFAALLFWSWVKGHQADINGLEKFMDFGFTKSILNSAYFPPPDMWYAGGTINYYYFGHTVMAMLTKLSGINLTYTFNLMLAALFALTLTMSYSIGFQLFKMTKSLDPHSQTRIPNKFMITTPMSLVHWLINSFRNLRFTIGNIIAGLVTAFLVTLAGNMQTLYAFTKGYVGDEVKPFWTLYWPLTDFTAKLSEGLNRYWYANATRFIPYTIHEFPSYSFVVSDIHGHVLSLPFVLLAIALLIAVFGMNIGRENSGDRKNQNNPKLKPNYLSPIMHYDLHILFYGFLVAALFMTNALDGPIYLGLFLVLYVLRDLSLFQDPVGWIKKHGLHISYIAVAGPVLIPFVLSFKSFVSGVAVNCPPARLANSKVGLLLFEGVEKCQHSPLWMMWLLWGFFIYCGIGLIIFKIKNSDSPSELRKSQSKNYYPIKSRFQFLVTSFSRHEIVLVIFFTYSILLIIFPEFFYFKDIYPMHFRSNTMFKLGYQAYIMFSIIAGYTITTLVNSNFLPRKTSGPEFSPSQNLGTRIFKSVGKKIFYILLIPQLFLVSIYPIFSVRSYFDSLREYKGIYGLTWLSDEYPDDYQAINWLNGKIENSELKSQPGNLPVIVEADGDSYTDYARFSAFTGLSTVIGWPVHEWLWRGSYDVVAPRREEVRVIYESTDLNATQQIISKYNISYIIVGQLERQKFTNLTEEKIKKIAVNVFTSGNTTIYRVF